MVLIVNSLWSGWGHIKGLVVVAALLLSYCLHGRAWLKPKDTLDLPPLP